MDFINDMYKSGVHSYFKWVLLFVKGVEVSGNKLGYFKDLGFTYWNAGYHLMKYIKMKYLKYIKYPYFLWKLIKWNKLHFKILDIFCITSRSSGYRMVYFVFTNVNYWDIFDIKRNQYCNVSLGSIYFASCYKYWQKKKVNKQMLN